MKENGNPLGIEEPLVTRTPLLESVTRYAEAPQDACDLLCTIVELILTERWSDADVLLVLSTLTHDRVCRMQATKSFTDQETVVHEMLRGLVHTGHLSGEQAMRLCSGTLSALVCGKAIARELQEANEKENE